MQVRRVRLQIETVRARITGILQLPTEGYRSRTTDFLNAHDTGFIALTEVELEPYDGGPPSSHAYSAVGSRHIVTLSEIEDLGVSEEDPVPPEPARTLGTTSTPPPPPH
jgi:hypothetical protein